MVPSWRSRAAQPSSNRQVPGHSRPPWHGSLASCSSTLAAFSRPSGCGPGGGSCGYIFFCPVQVAFQNNKAYGAGGALYGNGAALTVTNSTFLNNQCTVSNSMQPKFFVPMLLADDNHGPYISSKPRARGEPSSSTSPLGTSPRCAVSLVLPVPLRIHSFLAREENLFFSLLSWPWVGSCRTCSSRIRRTRVTAEVSMSAPAARSWRKI